MSKIELKICPTCHSPNLPIDLIIVPRSTFKAGLKASQSIVDKRRKPRSPIEKDIEVREFLCENENVLTYVELQNQLEKMFGTDRTPSTSAISRFFQR